MKTGFGQMKTVVTFSGWFALDIVGCKIFVLEARIGFNGLSCITFVSRLCGVFLVLHTNSFFCVSTLFYCFFLPGISICFVSFGNVQWKCEKGITARY